MFFKKIIKIFLCFSFCFLQTSDSWRAKVISSCAVEPRVISVNGKAESIWLQQLVIKDDLAENELADLSQCLFAESCIHHKYIVLFKDKESESLMQDRVAYEQHYREEILQESIVVGSGVNLKNQNDGIALAIKQAILGDIEESLRQF